MTLIPPQVITLTPPPPPTFIITPLPPGFVYLKPFSQVFALNQPTPNTSDTLWLYEANDTTPFQVLAQQGAFTHLVSQNGSLNFWTLNENVTQTPPIPPRFDTSVAGQTVQLVGSSIFACEGQSPGGLVLGRCDQLQDITQAQVIQRAQVDSSVIYLIQINGKTYWVSSNVLKSEPS